jgi:hypothetical protein
MTLYVMTLHVTTASFRIAKKKKKKNSSYKLKRYPNNSLNLLIVKELDLSDYFKYPNLNFTKKKQIPTLTRVTTYVNGKVS